MPHRAPVGPHGPQKIICRSEGQINLTICVEKMDIEMETVTKICKSLGMALNWWCHHLFHCFICSKTQFLFFLVLIFPSLDKGEHNDDLHPLSDKLVMKPAVCGHCSQGLCTLSVRQSSDEWHAELTPELTIPNDTLATLQHFSPKLLSEKIRVFF